MKSEVKFLIDHIFLEWSDYNPDLADKGAADFIKNYDINEMTTTEECKQKLLEFKHRMDAIRFMMV